LAYELSEFYKFEEYKVLFEVFSLKQQIEGDFVDLENSVNNAQLYGLLSMPIQGTDSRIILIEEPNKIYNSYSDECKNKMEQLVTSYINQLNWEIPRIAFIGDEHIERHTIASLLEKLSEKETCLRIDDCCRLLDSEIIDEVTREEQGPLLKKIDKIKK
jgi:hypothetical protein